MDGFSSSMVPDPVFGGTIYVLEVGPSDGPPLVLVHGVGAQGSADWYPVLKGLSAHFRVFAMDLPGFGRSGQSKVVYSPENYVRALHALTRARIGRPFHLAGHSMGGAVSLLYAGTYPQDVQRLVLVDAAGILHRHALAEHVASLSAENVPVGDVKGPVGLLTGVVKQGLRIVDIHPRRLVTSDAARTALLRNDPQTVAALALVEFNFGPAADGVTAPTALLWGKSDTVAPLRTAHALKARIRRATLQIFENSAHVPMATEPEAFVEAVQRHLFGEVIDSAPSITDRPSRGTGVCQNEKTAVFEGTFDTISIDNCGQVTLRNVQTGGLTVHASKVTIENSNIESIGIALKAVRSTVQMTGGRIEGDTGIHADDCTLDFAGVEITGRTRAVSEQSYAKLLFSICKVQSPLIMGVLHGLYSISEENPLEKQP